MIYGAILAGGIGKRVERHSIPKQFITIGGTPIIIITMRQFLKNKNLPIVYVAVHNDWILYAEKLFKNTFSKDELLKIRIVPGGKERLDSFENIMNDIIKRNGIHDEDILICHDSVRPFVTQQMIDDCIEATINNNFALTVIPVTDTIHTSNGDEDEYINGTLDRNGLYNGQTPSGFNLKILHNVCGQFDESEKKNFTGTTQLILKMGYKIKKVTGHTTNFKITTDNDLDVADKIVRDSGTRKSIQLLDCTLRDGGIVINFDFGIERMKKIKKCLENSGVDYIECGYIDEKKGSSIGRTCFDNEQSIKNTLLTDGKKPGVTYVAMVDYGTFDVNNLKNADENGIDGIRYAFHKENVDEALENCKIIASKGYKVYIQPMVSIRYSDDEFIDLISKCNKIDGAVAFYIVDSFGQMNSSILSHMFELADIYVNKSMSIGFHAHNNRQLAFSNACTFIKQPAKHNLMLDSSIMGMGKGAGNLCTELIMPILIEEGNSYTTVEIYDEINDYFSKTIKTNPWGYCLDYYISSLYGCTPSYVNIFIKDKRVTTEILIDILENMPNDKKAACDRKFAQEYIESYFSEVK